MGRSEGRAEMGYYTIFQEAILDCAVSKNFTHLSTAVEYYWLAFFSRSTREIRSQSIFASINLTGSW